MPLIRKPAPSAASTEIDVDRLAGDVASDLSSGSDEARWTAARVAHSLPHGLRLLTAALAQETVPRVREALFTGLARIGTPDSAAVVLRYLRSDEAGLRTGALDALRAMPDAAAVHLPDLLRDADADVRLLACELARGMADAEANRLLGDLLTREPAANVCGAAIEVLAETGDAASVPVLQGCASRFPDDPFLAFAVQMACDRIGSR